MRLRPRGGGGRAFSSETGETVQADGSSEGRDAAVSSFGGPLIGKRQWDELYIGIEDLNQRSWQRNRDEEPPGGGASLGVEAPSVTGFQPG